jgi:very-short-patch-repair endonuclease
MIATMSAPTTPSHLSEQRFVAHAEKRSMDILLGFRRELRREATDAEAALWHHLRGNRFGGFKFRRQHPCGRFVLDFFCVKAKLAVELDGGQHFEHATSVYDHRRTLYLVSRGITVLRFPTDLVFRELDGILEIIAASLGVGS